MRHMLARCVLLLALCSLVPAAPPATAASAKRVIVHFFTVPVTLPDGTPAKARLAELETWLTETCGGYTKLGQAVGGWKNEAGQTESETNIAYLVSSPRDVSAALAARLHKDFGERVPYVLTFPAGRFFP